MSLGIYMPNMPGAPQLPVAGPRDIVRATAEFTGIKVSALLGRRRVRVIARPRQVAMYLCREMRPDFSLPQIGRVFGRDHTTVIHAVRTIAKAQTDRDEATTLIVDGVRCMVLAGFRSLANLPRPAPPAFEECINGLSGLPMTAEERRQHEALMSIGLGPIKAAEAVVAMRKNPS